VSRPSDITAFNEFRREEGLSTIGTQWAICPTCRGNGTNSAHLGDVTEWLHEDPDAIEDYVSGFYDQLCECGGSGKVRVPAHIGDGELARAWADWQREEWEYRSICEQERRMGA
jgi:hypothetical protein